MSQQELLIKMFLQIMFCRVLQLGEGEGLTDLDEEVRRTLLRWRQIVFVPSSLPLAPTDKLVINVKSLNQNEVI